MHEIFKNPLLSRIPMPEFKTRFIPVKIGEADEELVLRAELLGFSKDEIKLKVTPRAIYISAEKKKHSVEKNEKIYKVESGFTSSSRVIPLPEEVKTEGVKAKFENGVLEVIMPKKEAKKEKDVRIE
jgi:HSP20 family protein